MTVDTYFIISVLSVALIGLVAVGGTVLAVALSPKL
jgi:hypothetical protein